MGCIQQISGFAEVNMPKMKSLVLRMKSITSSLPRPVIWKVFRITMKTVRICIYRFLTKITMSCMMIGIRKLKHLRISRMEQPVFSNFLSIPIPTQAVIFQLALHLCKINIISYKKLLSQIGKAVFFCLFRGITFRYVAKTYIFPLFFL